MLMISPLFAVAVLITAVLIDHCFGEPKRGHPLVIFGAMAGAVESQLYSEQLSPRQSWLRGGIAVAVVLSVLMVPLSLLAHWLADSRIGYFFFCSLLLYYCIAARSLREHARAVQQPLQCGDLQQARDKLSYIVSRDVESLSEQEVAVAVCESVLENGNDAVFAALFWFLVAGIPGVLVYRAANTLDAMWGYRNQRYQYFGCVAARLDDLLNWLPARLVALSYALVGNFTVAIRCWREQAAAWKSPNAGPVMAAGAGSLTIRLGGAARYDGELQHRPVLGAGAAATVDDIARASALVDRVLWLWIVLITVLMGFISIIFV